MTLGRDCPFCGQISPKRLFVCTASVDCWNRFCEDCSTIVVFNGKKTWKCPECLPPPNPIVIGVEE